MKKGSKKKSSMRIFFRYLKNDKGKLIVYVIFSMLSYLPELFSAFMVGKALELLLLKEFRAFVNYLFCFEAMYIFSKCIASVIKQHIHNTLEIKFINEVSKDIYDKYQNLPASAFEEIGVGELTNRLYTDTDRILELLSRIVRLTCKLIVAIIVIVIAFSVSAFIGFEILLFAVIMGFISYGFFPKLKGAQQDVKKDADKFLKRTTENLSGIREIKALGIKGNMQRIINNNIDDLCENNLKIRNFEISYYAINAFIYFGLQFIILYTCGYLFVKGHIAYSIFMMIEMYIGKIDDVVSSLSEFGVSVTKVKVSLTRLGEVLDNELYEDERFGNVTLRNVKGILTFKNVSFKYPDHDDNTLRGLSLEFNPNRKIAIVGRSGNGKSTILNLVLRYFDAQKGEILLDGVNIKDLTEKSLRKNISVVRQNPFLFNMSILDNFRLVKPNVTLKEVEAVCKKAYIDSYIKSLPNGYNSIIGEGGINLSGGQKQRLAIARTLLLDTKIILFDEATSSLDNESQEYIKKTINNLVKDHTIIIVAHRLSTIIDADEIHVIDKGKLVSSGKHKELLKESKIYKTLYINEDIKGE